MVFRLEPPLPARAYQTYRVDAPLATHWRRASCDEYGCAAYQNGWVTRVDERVEQGMAQAYYIRKQSGRSFTEEKLTDGLTEFRFPAGQPCFSRSRHRLPVGRPEIFLRLGGDWRGNPLGTPAYRHTKPEYWIEDFQESLEEMRNGG